METDDDKKSFGDTHRMIMRLSGTIERIDERQKRAEDNLDRMAMLLEQLVKSEAEFHAHIRTNNNNAERMQRVIDKLEERLDRVESESSSWINIGKGAGLILSAVGVVAFALSTWLISEMMTIRDTVKSHDATINSIKK